jgi:hypothetical protein
MSFTDFEKNKLMRLTELINKIDEIADEYHAELYLVDEFWDNITRLRNTVKKEMLNNLTTQP